MSTMEVNKIMAAILLAGIIGMASGFIANLLVHPEEPEQTAFRPDVGAEPAATGGEEPAEEVNIASLLPGASAEEGEAFSRACQSCHTFEQGGPNRVGPNLFAIVGADMAHLEDFNYSSALQTAHDEGRTWGYEELNAFLQNPRDYMPGTSMSYAGIRDPEDRANVIAYLRSMDDDPPPLPEPPAEAEEAAAAEGEGEAAAVEADQAAAEGDAGTAEAAAEAEAAEAGEAAAEEAAAEEGAAGTDAGAEGEPAAEGETPPEGDAAEGEAAADEAAADEAESPVELVQPDGATAPALAPIVEEDEGPPPATVEEGEGVEQPVE